MSPLEQRFCVSQITIITNFIVVSSVGIKGIYCISDLNTPAVLFSILKEKLRLQWFVLNG